MSLKLKLSNPSKTSTILIVARLMKNPVSKHLVLIALSATVAVSAQTPAPSPLPALAEGMIPAIRETLGSVSIGMDLYRYNHVTTTLYRGIKSSTTRDTTAVGMTASSAGTTSYKTNIRMSGPGLENPVNITDTSPFTFSFGGSDGDVPFELRKHSCSMATTSWNGSPDIFKYTTDSQAIYRINHRYTQNPLFKFYTTPVSINCINWQKEREACLDVGGTMSYAFDAIAVNNGTSYQGISGPINVNMRHVVGSGIGLTW